MPKANDGLGLGDLRKKERDDAIGSVADKHYYEYIQGIKRQLTRARKSYQLVILIFNFSLVEDLILMMTRYFVDLNISACSNYNFK